MEFDLTVDYTPREEPELTDQTSSVPGRLRKMREDAGISQIDLAARLGVTNTHISNIERGKGGYSIGLVARWAEECGRQLGDLFVDQDRSWAVDVIQSLNQEQWAAVAQMLRLAPRANAETLRNITGLLSNFLDALGDYDDS